MDIYSCIHLNSCEYMGVCVVSAYIFSFEIKGKHGVKLHKIFIGQRY